jgi:hypothetical protein
MATTREQDDVAMGIAEKHGAASCTLLGEPDPDGERTALVVGLTEDGVEAEYVLVTPDGVSWAAEHMRGAVA